MAVLKLPLVVQREIPEIVFENDKKVHLKHGTAPKYCGISKENLLTGKLIVRFIDDESNR